MIAVVVKKARIAIVERVKRAKKEARNLTLVKVRVTTNKTTKVY
jgi:hypothetical protein